MVIITRAEEEEEILSKFVADMPTKLSWQSPLTISDFWVFWRQEEEEEEAISQLTSSTTSSVLAIRNHIKTALCSFNCFSFTRNVLVQFWAPTRTTIGSVHVLTTSNEPFALPRMNEDLLRYRKHCHSYDCGVGVGIPGRAFRNQVNEYSHDVSYYSIDDYPQRELALSCGFTEIMAVPIFQDHSCVGVLELLVSSVDDLGFYYVLRSVFTALEGTGLKFINPEKRQEQLPKQGAYHLEKEEISNALKHACENCHLLLACAWVRSVNSTSMGHCGNLSCTGELVVPIMSQTIAGTYNFTSWDASCLAMRLGHGLLGNAFLSHKPFLCRDVTQLGMSDYPMAHTARKSGFTTCFAIVLQRIATGNRDYALEFFLPKGTTYSRSDFHGLLSSILAILKRHLKSFKPVTGDLGDELFIEIDKSSINTIFESLKTCPNIVAHIESGALQNEGEVQADFSNVEASMVKEKNVICTEQGNTCFTYNTLSTSSGHETTSSSRELTSFHTISSRSDESTLNSTRRTPNICTRPSGNRSYLDHSPSKINEPVHSETGSSYSPTTNVYREDSSLPDAPHSEASAVVARTIPPSTMGDVEMVTVNENARTIPPSTMVDVEMVTVDHENYEEEL